MINKIKTIWLNYSDKILHFLFGYVIASQFQGVGYYMIIPPFVIGMLKEYFDAKSDNVKPSIATIFNADWACTFAGGFYALVVYALSLYSFGVNLPNFINVTIIK